MIDDIVFVDLVVFALSLLVAIHIRKNSGVPGLTSAVAVLAIACVSEQLSVRLGETHCHAASPFVNVSKCSSLNSIAVYLPWMYSCYHLAKCVPFSSELSRLLYTGILHPLFFTMYEITGANAGWWAWGDKVEALNERVFGVPVMTVAFHFLVGFTFALILDLSSKRRLPSWIQVCLVFLFAPAFACLMLTAFNLFTPLGFSRLQVTFVTLIATCGFLLCDRLDKRKAFAMNPAGAEPVLVAIPLIWCLFILQMNVREAISANESLFIPHRLFVFVNVAVALATLMYISGSGSGGGPKKSKRKS